MTECCEKPTPLPPSPCCCSKPNPPPFTKVSSDWTRDDARGAAMCRLSDAFRRDYRVLPGLYALGSPGPDAPVFVSANYRLSFNILRRALKGIPGWVLVLDTKGINVWCAAGKGSFGTKELIGRIESSRLGDHVTHRTVIVPQLGAPGITAHEVTKATGFGVKYGPVLAGDLPAYLRDGFRATPAMRTVTFPFADRCALIPMELLPALRKLAWIVLAAGAFMGLMPEGILFGPAFSGLMPFLVTGLLSIFAGTVVTPALLPFIPARSFALKGTLAGALLLLPMLLFIDRLFLGSVTLACATVTLFLAAASYLALNFTGCTTFTNISGVKKEMRIAVPLYITACAIAALLLVLFKLREWSIL